MILASHFFPQLPHHPGQDLCLFSTLLWMLLSASHTKQCLALYYFCCLKQIFSRKALVTIPKKMSCISFMHGQQRPTLCPAADCSWDFKTTWALWMAKQSLVAQCP